MKEILVIDDDPDVLDATKRALKRHGYLACTVDNPQTALSLLKENQNRFEVILLDWKLKCPLDGDMILDLIHCKFPDFKTPIIFVTAHTNIASKYLLKLGAYETLKKPVRSDELIDAIERALGKKQPEDPHRKAPADLTWQQMKTHELSRKIINALRKHGSLAASARALDCSVMSLRRWLRIAKLDSFLIESDQSKRKPTT